MSFYKGVLILKWRHTHVFLSGAAGSPRRARTAWQPRLFRRCVQAAGAWTQVELLKQKLSFSMRGAPVER